MPISTCSSPNCASVISPIIRLRHYRNGMSTTFTSKPDMSTIPITRTHYKNHVSTKTESSVEISSLNSRTVCSKTVGKRKNVRISDGPAHVISEEGGLENTNLMMGGKDVKDGPNNNNNGVTGISKVVHGLPFEEDDSEERIYKNGIDPDSEDDEYSWDDEREKEDPWAGREGKKKWALQTLLNTEHNAISKNLTLPPQQPLQRIEDFTFLRSSTRTTTTNRKEGVSVQCSRSTRKYVKNSNTQHQKTIFSSQNEPSQQQPIKEIKRAAATTTIHEQKIDKFRVAKIAKREIICIHNNCTTTSLPSINSPQIVPKPATVPSTDTKSPQKSADSEEEKTRGQILFSDSIQIPKNVSPQINNAPNPVLSPPRLGENSCFAKPEGSEIVMVKDQINQENLITDTSSSSVKFRSWFNKRDNISSIPSIAATANKEDIKVDEELPEIPRLLDSLIDGGGGDGNSSDLGSLSDFMLGDLCNNNGLLDEISNYFDKSGGDLSLISSISKEGVKEFGDEPQVSTESPVKLIKKVQMVDHQSEAIPRDSVEKKDKNKLFVDIKSNVQSNDSFHCHNLQDVSTVEPFKREDLISPLYEELDYGGALNANKTFKTGLKFCTNSPSPPPCKVEEPINPEITTLNSSRFQAQQNVPNSQIGISNEAPSPINNNNHHISNSSFTPFFNSIITKKGKKRSTVLTKLLFGKTTNGEGSPLSNSAGFCKASAAMPMTDKSNEEIISIGSNTSPQIPGGCSNGNPLNKKGGGGTREIKKEDIFLIVGPPSASSPSPLSSSSASESPPNITTPTAGGPDENEKNSTPPSQIETDIFNVPEASKNGNGGTGSGIQIWKKTFFGTSNLANRIMQFGDSSSFLVPAQNTIKTNKNHYRSSDTNLFSGQLNHVASQQNCNFSKQGQQRAPSVPTNLTTPQYPQLKSHGLSKTPSFNAPPSFYGGGGEPSFRFFQQSSSPSFSDNIDQKPIKGNTPHLLLQFPPGPLSKSNRSRSLDKTTFFPENETFSVPPLLVGDPGPEFLSLNKDEDSGDLSIVGSFAFDLSKYTSRMTEKLHRDINEPVDTAVSGFPQSSDSHNLPIFNKDNNNNNTLLKFSTLKKMFIRKTQQGICSLMTGGHEPAIANSIGRNSQRSSLGGNFKSASSQLFTRFAPPDGSQLCGEKKPKMEEINLSANTEQQSAALTESQVLALNSVLDSFSSEENWSVASSNGSAIPQDPGIIADSIKDDNNNNDIAKENITSSTKNDNFLPESKTLTKLQQGPPLNNETINPFTAIHPPNKPLPPIPISNTSATVPTSILTQNISANHNTSSSSEFSGEGVMGGARLKQSSNKIRGGNINKPKVPPPKPPATVPRTIAAGQIQNKPRSLLILQPQQPSSKIGTLAIQTDKPKIPNRPPNLIKSNSIIKTCENSPSIQNKDKTERESFNGHQSEINIDNSNHNQSIVTQINKNRCHHVSGIGVVVKTSPTDMPKRKPPPPPPVLKERQENISPCDVHDVDDSILCTNLLYGPSKVFVLVERLGNSNLPVTDPNEYYDPPQHLNQNSPAAQLISATSSIKANPASQIARSSSSVSGAPTKPFLPPDKVENGSTSNSGFNCSPFYEEYLTPNATGASNNSVNLTSTVDNQSIQSTRKVLKLLESKIAIGITSSSHSTHSLPNFTSGSKHPTAIPSPVHHQRLTVKNNNCRTRSEQLKKPPIISLKCANAKQAAPLMLDDQRNLIIAGLKPSEIKKNQKLKTNSSFKF